MLKPNSIITRRRFVCFQWFLDQNDRNSMGILFQTSKGQNSSIFNKFLRFLFFWYETNDLFFRGQKSEKLLASQQRLAPLRPRYLMVPYSTIWYHMVPYGTIWYLMVPYGTIWYHMVQDMVPYGTSRYLTVPYGTLWYPLVPYGTLWYLMIPYGTLWCHKVPKGTIRYQNAP